MSKDELDALAHKIALQAACSDIECFCEQPVQGWYDVYANIAAGMSDSIQDSRRYLAARDMIEENPRRQYLIRIKYKEEAATEAAAR